MPVGDLAVLLIAALSVAFIGSTAVRLTSSKAATGRLDVSVPKDEPGP